MPNGFKWPEEIDNDLEESKEPIEHEEWEDVKLGLISVAFIFACVLCVGVLALIALFKHIIAS